MHIAAANPLYLRKEDVLPELVEKEIEIARDRAINEGKPQRAHDAIIKGRLDKFYEEVCLLEQPFVKDSTMTIDQIVKSKIAKLKENITIARFTRYKVGDGTAATVAAAE
jgi:elongation factor Ts